MWVHRHIEIQIMADSQVMCCIYSKRMQHPASSPKVIEEALLRLTPELRKKMGEAAFWLPNLVIIRSWNC
jgi:biotin carboxylase